MDGGWILMKKVMLGLVLVMIFVVLAGCGKTGTATVTGYIMAPNGVDPVVGATVSVKGKGISTTTNGAGKYTLTNVPVGKQTIQAVKGNFKVEFTVKVTNSSTPIEAPVAKMNTKKIGVVEGIYDDIGAVLTNLGLDYTTIGSFYDLDDPDVTDDYSVIFLACGGSYEVYSGSAIYNNLRAFVSKGGGIYASDWSAQTIATLFPEYISLCGLDGNIQTVTATVLDNDIKALLGKSSCEICYDLPGWAVIEVEDSTKVSVDMVADVSTSEGDIEDSPLLVEFSYGSGNVIYTTFHNEEQVTVDGLKIIKHLVFSL